LKPETVNFKWLAAVLLIAAAAPADLVNKLAETDPVAGPVVSGIVQGTQPLDGVLLDRQISSWSEIGLTYMDAVRLNSEVTVSNDAVWTGWITTGDLLTNNTIFLTEGEILESPVQAGGVARFNVTASSSGNGTGWSAWVMVGTNQMSVPYQGSNGVLRITCGSTMPGQTAGMTVSAVKITGYSNASEAETPKTVSGLRVIEEPADEESVTPRWYVDAEAGRSRAYSDAQLASYAADGAKTVSGAQLRLNPTWTAVQSGTAYILSAGEISGDGSLAGTTNEFVFSKNDYPLLAFSSAASGLHINGSMLVQAGSNAVVTLYIATNGVVSEPFGEWADSLVAGGWHRPDGYLTNSYPAAVNGSYVLSYSAPFETSHFFRAMQPAGESVARVKADALSLNGHRIKDVSEIVFTNGAKLVVSGNTLIIQPAP
jgi:hypothetical protein